MRKVIDFLKEADKEKLAEAYLEHDILAIFIDVIDKEKCMQLIDELCATEIGDEESKYAVLMQIGISDNMNALYRIFNQNAPARIISSMDIEIKDLLSAEVSSKICKPAQIEFMLLCVLHSAIKKEYGEEILDHLEPDEDILEAEEIIAGFTETEQKLYENMQKAAMEFNEHFMKKAFDEFLQEKESWKTQGKGCNNDQRKDYIY